MELDADNDHPSTSYHELVGGLSAILLRFALAYESRLPVPRSFLTALLPPDNLLISAAADQAITYLAEFNLIGEAGAPDWLVLLPQGEEVALNSLDDPVMPGAAVSIQEAAEIVVGEALTRLMRRYDREQLRDVLPQAMYVTDRAIATTSKLSTTLCAYTGVALAWVGWPQAEQYLDQLLSLDLEPIQSELILLAAQVGVQAVVAAEQGSHERAERYSRLSNALLSRSRQRDG